MKASCIQTATCGDPTTEELTKTNGVQRMSLHSFDRRSGEVTENGFTLGTPFGRAFFREPCFGGLQGKPRGRKNTRTTECTANHISSSSVSLDQWPRGKRDTLCLLAFQRILWMDEILHHLRNPGMMILLQIPTSNGFPWFPRWCETDFATIHSIAPGKNRESQNKLRFNPEVCGGH